MIFCRAENNFKKPRWSVPFLGYHVSSPIESVTSPRLPTCPGDIRENDPRIGNGVVPPSHRRQHGCRQRSPYNFKSHALNTSGADDFCRLGDDARIRRPARPAALQLQNNLAAKAAQLQGFLQRSQSMPLPVLAATTAAANIAANAASRLPDAFAQQELQCCISLQLVQLQQQQPAEAATAAAAAAAVTAAAAATY